jgi:hypothetical protein
MNDHPRFLPLTPSDAKATYGLGDHTLSSLPPLFTLSATHPRVHKACQRRVDLVDGGAAQKAGITLHRSMRAMNAFVAKVNSEARFEQEQRHLLYQDHGVTFRLRIRHLNLSDRATSKQYRFMGVICFPYLNHDTRTLELGLSCTVYARGYQLNKPERLRALDWRRMYTKQGYLRHLAECEQPRTALALP